MYWLTFGISLVSSLALVPIVRRFSYRIGSVVTPREDRWHRDPTPTLGGIGIFTAFIISLLASSLVTDHFWEIKWGILAGSILVFFLGLLDDLKKLSPPAKLVGQILAASVVIFQGYTTDFFASRLPGSVIAQVPDIILTFLWLVGITNAINLLDNMDGLAGGISFIKAVIRSLFFWQADDLGFLQISIALTGSSLGFLFYNFPPAKIFMGDSGSLFLGFTLAILAIARHPQASNVLAVMGVPIILFLLPILDTTLVTVTRLLRGQSPTQGGRDHASHRLIAFGLNERQAVLVLYVIAIVAGMMAIAIETLDYWLSLVLVPILVLSLAIFTAYLGRLKVVVTTPSTKESSITRLMVDLTYRRRSFEIILDFFLIGIAYYLAFWTYSGLSMTEDSLQIFLLTLPIAYAGSYLSFFLFGVYRGVWRYIGVGDLMRYAKSTLGSVLVVSIAVYLLFIGTNYSLVPFILYAVYLFLGLAASRSSFKILDQMYGSQARKAEERVLIIGAGDEGEMAVRWILMNPKFGYRPVGFLDNDPYNAGRHIHDVEILGTFHQLGAILDQKNVDGVVLTTDSNIHEDELNMIKSTCQGRGCWVRTLRLEFELVE
jgi:UDP-GlcNAc:undecaprenyl-phosphate GlcNAc-1-phosphate transferase